MVQRYKQYGGDVEHDKNGELVKYSDYQKIEIENAGLKRFIKEIKREFGRRLNE